MTPLPIVTPIAETHFGGHCHAASGLRSHV
jgi:hypothetical protein